MHITTLTLIFNKIHNAKRSNRLSYIELSGIHSLGYEITFLSVAPTATATNPIANMHLILLRKKAIKGKWNK